MYMLAAARACLIDNDGESLMFDSDDYEAALSAAVRNIAEQMQGRGGLKTARTRELVAAALTEMRHAVPDQATVSPLDAETVHEWASCAAAEFWTAASDADCVRVAAAATGPPPKPAELPPAAFAGLALHAGSASGWESLSEEEHNAALDGDGNTGGCRWREVHADLDELPYEGLGLTRGAELLEGLPTEIPDGETVPTIIPTPPEGLMAGMAPGLELVIDAVAGGALYEERIPGAPDQAPTRTRVNPADYRNEAATEVLLHLLIAGDATAHHPASLPPGSGAHTILRNLPDPTETLAETARLATAAHYWLYRSASRARATAHAATRGVIPESLQRAPQAIMEACIAAGFAWRWLARILACWDDPDTRSRTLTEGGHALACVIAEEAAGCFAGGLDGNGQTGDETVQTLAQLVADAAVTIGHNNIDGLCAFYNAAAPGTEPGR